MATVGQLRGVDVERAVGVGDRGADAFAVDVEIQLLDAGGDGGVGQRGGGVDLDGSVDGLVVRDAGDLDLGNVGIGLGEQVADEHLKVGDLYGFGEGFTECGAVGDVNINIGVGEASRYGVGFGDGAGGCGGAGADERGGLGLIAVIQCGAGTGEVVRPGTGQIGRTIGQRECGVADDRSPDIGTIERGAAGNVVFFEVVDAARGQIGLGAGPLGSTRDGSNVVIVFEVNRALGLGAVAGEAPAAARHSHPCISRENLKA